LAPSTTKTSAANTGAAANEFTTAAAVTGATTATLTALAAYRHVG
jgi:hypothetical protein